MKSRTLALLLAGLTATTAQAAFHVMQLEQIIGGVDGDNTSQAIQLRLRTGGQNQVQNTRLRAFDATGANPVLLLDIATAVPNALLGDNILLASAAFNTDMAGTPGYASDFTLANVIPASYLIGGKVTFEQDNGTILWSIAFGSYTGTNVGSTVNDADGNFGAPFASPLPTNGRLGIRFTGASNAPSTTNVLNYAFTSEPATVRNNARNSFTVVPEPGTAALLATFGLGALAIARRRTTRPGRKENDPSRS